MESIEFKPEVGSDGSWTLCIVFLFFLVFFLSGKFMSDKC